MTKEEEKKSGKPTMEDVRAAMAGVDKLGVKDTSEYWRRVEERLKIEPGGCRGLFEGCSVYDLWP